MNKILKIKLIDFELNLLLAAFLLQGFGDLIIGNFKIAFPLIFIYILFLSQIITKRIIIFKFLFFLYLYIFIQSFIFLHVPLEGLYLFHYIGLIILSTTLFNFIYFNFNNYKEILNGYFNMCVFISKIVFIQLILNLFFNLSFKPHVIFHLKSFYPFEKEILGILPRAIGLSTEPASFVILMLPSIFLALLVIGKKIDFIPNKKINLYLLFGSFFLSFSIVGYFLFILISIYIFKNVLKQNKKLKRNLIYIAIPLILIIVTSTIFNKIKTLPNIISNANTYEYTTNDLSGFALISNFFVALNALVESNYIGKGINTHQVSYNKFIYNIFDISQVPMEGLNQKDAGSLYIRIISEYGLPGFFLFLFFLYRYFIKKSYYDVNLKLTNNMSIFMILSFAFRNGGYLDIFLHFFFAISYFTYINNKKFILYQ